MNKEMLKTYRKKLGFSQRKLSAILRLHNTTVMYWEKGVHSISMPEVVRLALEHLTKESNISQEKKVA